VIDMDKPEKKGELRLKRSSPLLAMIFLAIAGSFFLFLSFRFNSLLLGLIGLGFFFFASLLYLIAPRWFFRGEILTSMVNSNLSLLRRLLGPGGFPGKGFYIPSEDGEIFVFVSKEEALLQPPESGSIGKKLFSRSPEGIVLSPPGSELLKTIEDLTGANFDEAELHYALSILSGAFMELEISRGFEFIVERDQVIVRMEDVVGKGFCKEIELRFPGLCEQIGCPFCSAIACIVSKSLGKPVIIDYVDVSPDGRVTEAVFRVIR